MKQTHCLSLVSSTNAPKVDGRYYDTSSLTIEIDGKQGIVSTKLPLEFFYGMRTVTSGKVRDISMGINAIERFALKAHRLL